MLSWCFVKHHAMHVCVGRGTVCLPNNLLNKSTNGILFEGFFFNLLLTCMKATLVGIMIALVCEGGNTELLLQNCFTLHIGW